MTASTHLTFRAANNNDVDTIVELVESAYRGDASRVGWTTEADFLDGRRTGSDDVLAQIARPRSRILLAERDGELLASAHVADEDGAGYFGMFSVQPGLQNTGIGKSMLAEAERIAREEWKLPSMRMTVIDIRAELIAWYERRGYSLTTNFEPFPYDDPKFGLPKVKGLKFVLLRKETAMIRKLKSGEYRLYSRKKDPDTGKRRNLGTFKTRKAAEKHEQDVQYFQRH